MKIYKYENDIKDLVIARAKTRVISSVSIIDNEKAQEILIDKIKNSNNVLVKTIAENIVNKEHPDLLFGSAILASTVMNKNDDVFLPEDTWKAKDTPVNTPFNEQHEETAIIGHIISSYVMDSKGNKYTGDTAPDYFDIAVNFVVYKEIFPAVAEKISTLGPKNKAFVSMEAIMDDFDYALIDAKGSIKIVKRNDNTSFLTKSLRAFGGTGKYGAYRVGRVLRDFRFSGMGDVDDPANPKSIYFDIEKDTSISEAVLTQASKRTFDKFDSFIIYTKGNVMVIEDIEQAKTVIAELQEKLKDFDSVTASAKQTSDKLTEALASVESEKAKAAEIETKLVEASNKVAELDSKVAIATQAVEAAKAEVETIKKELEEKTKANDALNKTLEEYKKASQKSNRTAAMKDLGFEVSEEESEKYASMSEDVFATLLSFAEKNKKKDNKKKEDDANDDNDNTTDAATKALEQTDEDKAIASSAENNGASVTAPEDQLKATASELAKLLTEKKNTKSKINKK